MVEKIGLVACSTSGIDYVNVNYPVEVIRQVLNLDGKEYQDFIDLQAQEFYNRLVDNPNIDVSTSQTATGRIADVYEKMKNEGYTHIIVISLSSRLSGTFQGAVLAKSLVEDINVYVIDSRSVAYGELFLIREAIKLINSGAKARDIIDYLEKTRDHIYSYVLVDTLKFLVKNGRLSATSGFFRDIIKN